MSEVPLYGKGVWGTGPKAAVACVIGRLSKPVIFRKRARSAESPRHVGSVACISAGLPRS